jgi:hypothetical protein
MQLVAYRTDWAAPELMTTSVSRRANTSISCCIYFRSGSNLAELGLCGAALIGGRTSRSSRITSRLPLLTAQWRPRTTKNTRKKPPRRYVCQKSKCAAPTGDRMDVCTGAGALAGRFVGNVRPARKFVGRRPLLWFGYACRSGLHWPNNRRLNNADHGATAANVSTCCLPTN